MNITEAVEKYAIEMVKNNPGVRMKNTQIAILLKACPEFYSHICIESRKDDKTVEHKEHKTIEVWERMLRKLFAHDVNNIKHMKTTYGIEYCYLTKSWYSMRSFEDHLKGTEEAKRAIEDLKKYIDVLRK